MVSKEGVEYIALLVVGAIIGGIVGVISLGLIGIVVGPIGGFLFGNVWCFPQKVVDIL